MLNWPKCRRILEVMFGLDLRSLALYRVTIALVILGDLLIRSMDLKMFYSDAGVYPRSALVSLTPNSWFISLYLVNGSVAFQAMLFILTAVLAFGLLIGYRTRWMTIGCWFMVSSLHARNFSLPGR